MYLYYGGSGGGVSLSVSNCYISECSFEGNTSSLSAGGINISRSVVMSNCTFTGNSGEAGGVQR